MTTTGQIKVSSQALKVLEERYFLKNDDQKIIEDTSGMFRRVAKAVASAEKANGTTRQKLSAWEEEFYSIMARREFIPNSPALMNLGTGQGTASACYVLPIEDNMESISKAFNDQLFVEKYGGGVGFSLSKIRPKGYPISTTQGKACGPIRVLKNLSENGKLITQGGKRDGAHMAVMSVYHPDILEFITCKAKEGDIHNFNISVGADSNFMKAVEDDKYIRLTWPLDNIAYNAPRTDLSGEFIRATDIWEKLTEGAWKNGEPGMLWLDKINEDNATPELGDIVATNPCGEQPLLGNESCNLGSINVAKFVDSKGQFKEAGFIRTIRTAVRFLDNVIDVNKHPTKDTSAMNLQTRKIGLGLMGWADFLIKMRIRYGSPESFTYAEKVGSILKKEADNISAQLGESKGDFPAFDKSPLNKNNGGTWDHMRNAWRLSIAPTGTIAMIADCSNGIEPIIGLAWKKQNMSAALENVSLHYINEDAKSIIDNNPSRLNGHGNLDDYLADGNSMRDLLTEEESVYFPSTYDVDHMDHVRMQSVFQKYIDSGISKTINMSNDSTLQDVKDVYSTAWKSGCKGITVYRKGTRLLEVIVSKDDLPNYEDSVTHIASPKTKTRPRVVNGSTSQINTGHGSLYVTVNTDEDGEPFEIFSSLGKAGNCEPATLEAISRLASLALRSGISSAEIADQLKGITCHPAFDDGRSIKSIPDGIAQVLNSREKEPVYSIEAKQELVVEKSVESIDNPCPECGSELHMIEGCMTCVCGFGKCE